ncbi:MAG: collagen-binding domain-containing protein, partial [Chthoniobacterales bacterium]
FTGTLTIEPNGSNQTYVAIHVTGDITGNLTIRSKVHVQVFFDGNVNVKARDLVNESGLAGNMQFYGISPADPSTTQTIAISPPGNFQGTFYAPSADFTLNGNPDIVGAVVCKTFYGNGNTSWHYDRALDTMGDAVDYRVASYVEDTR